MVQKFEYKRATMEDIDEMVRTRIIVLRAANKLSDDEDMSVVEEESKAYYRRVLETGEHIAYLVYDNGAFVGAGGVSFYQVMPTYHNPTGKKAYIMMEELFEKGCRSPFLYLEAWNYISSDTTLLHRMSSFWTQVFLFAGEKGLLTEELVMRFAYLTGYEREFCISMYRALEIGRASCRERV